MSCQLLRLIGKLSFPLIPNMVLLNMKNHEHRTKQTNESYTFQPFMGFWFEGAAVHTQATIKSCRRSLRDIESYVRVKHKPI